MYTYKDMVEKAQEHGVTNEKIMWESIDSLSDMLCVMRKEHPDKYWAFMREQHGLMYGNHYDQEFAEWDVDHINYTNRAGEKKSGAYWTAEQIEQATASMKFPAGTTKWDKYVAFNNAYADYNRKFEDGDVLEIGYLMFFADEDWGSNTKIWEYISSKPKS